MDPDFPIAVDKKHPTWIRSTDSTALLPRLRLGDVFGELSLLYDEPRSAGSQWDLIKLRIVRNGGWRLHFVSSLAGICWDDDSQGFLSKVETITQT